MKKKQLNEEKILCEFIGKIASYMFMKKADKLVKATKQNPKLHNAIENITEIVKLFKKQLKDMGITDSEDLVRAVNANPNIKNKETETSKQAFDRIDKELGDLF